MHLCICTCIYMHVYVYVHVGMYFKFCIYMGELSKSTRSEFHSLTDEMTVINLVSGQSGHHQRLLTAFLPDIYQTAKIKCSRMILSKSTQSALRSNMGYDFMEFNCLLSHLSDHS